MCKSSTNRFRTRELLEDYRKCLRFRGRGGQRSGEEEEKICRRTNTKHVVRSHSWLMSSGAHSEPSQRAAEGFKFWDVLQILWVVCKSFGISFSDSFVLLLLAVHLVICGSRRLGLINIQVRPRLPLEAKQSVSESTHKSPQHLQGIWNRSSSTAEGSSGMYNESGMLGSE